MNMQTFKYFNQFAGDEISISVEITCEPWSGVYHFTLTTGFKDGTAEIYHEQRNVPEASALQMKRDFERQLLSAVESRI